MAANKSLLLLPGDGIGPEVMSQVKRVIEWMDRRRAVRFEISEDLVGGAAIDAHGVPLADATLEKALVVDAVLFGAVGGPKWDNLDFKIKPERGLLRLRKDLGLFANLRPAICFEALADASTLKREVVEGLDILILREVQRLSQEDGVNLSGIKRILELELAERRSRQLLAEMHAEVSQLRAQLESTRAVAARLAGMIRSRPDAAELVPVHHFSRSGHPESAHGITGEPGQTAAAVDLGSPPSAAGNAAGTG